jgi:preprotein translocase subunit YajC
MNTNLQKGQKVLTPDGGGLVESILEQEITVKLDSGELRKYNDDELEDDSDQG